ncbi:MAG: beta-galactosidase, partial [Lachnospiraceae bacterium]|nr:beta-galactosidase [Lachnospiraceae bacterium]
MTDRQLHEFLQDPEIFGENLVPAHSDHFFYEKEKDVALGADMPLKQSLNGTWKFKYSINLKERPKDFFKADFDCKGFENIKVPGHIEMQGHDVIHYTNTNYPWDGIEDLLPPAISEEFNPVGSYVRDFKVSKNLKDKPLFISFQG